MPSLFQNVDFTGHSGQPLTWKIDCDALTRDDWVWAAARVAERVKFHRVEGIPQGGLPFAEALRPLAEADANCLLIVDDVLTTGASMTEAVRKFGINLERILGVVFFARIPPPEPWIKALFVMPEWT